MIDQSVIDQSVIDQSVIDQTVIDQTVIDQTVIELDRGAPPEYPLDDLLRLNHVQALGTHNSYHLSPIVEVRPWRYSHLPLDRQLGDQGVRQFELDLYQTLSSTFDVYHFPLFDDVSTCPTLRACLQVMKSWSDTHLDHHPIMVLLEPKGIWRSSEGSVLDIEEAISEIWPEDRLLTPALVQRDAEDIRGGLEAEGWPTLGESRGRLMVVLHSGGALREAYLRAPGGTRSRLMFPDAYGDLSAPFAAYHSMNDPLGGGDAIQTVVRAGHLVRTRADSDSEEYVSRDDTRGQRALFSGAHFISTDYPTPPTDEEYGFIIPDGTPSRCNPLTAPDPCTSEDLESR